MDILIFDMDGVLIDVTDSYRKTIQETIQLYFQLCLGYNFKKKLIKNEEISLFKSAGGFNNDWDLTSGILLYLFSISGLPPFEKKKISPSIKDNISLLREKASKFKIDNNKLLYKMSNINHFLREVKSNGGGFRGVRLALKGSWDGWLYSEGDFRKENIVKRIFQEIYLGKKFYEFYHFDPIIYRGKGRYLNERLLIPRKILSSIKRKVKMGIASGRPRLEVYLALKRFNLLHYFKSIITLDECQKEEQRVYREMKKRVSLSKPNPFPILKAIRNIGLKNPVCGYIGDVVDDIIAANRAKKFFNLIAIGFLSKKRGRNLIKDSLTKAGADIIIEKPDDLLKLID